MALRDVARSVRDHWERWGPSQAPDVIESEAQAYWRDQGQAQWASNSHWREGVGDHWERIGSSALELAEQLVRVTGLPLPAGRTVEWGAGGGANAVQFAPRCKEFVAVDISGASLVECERQVALTTSTPVRTVLVDLAAPETAVPEIGRATCDLFLCLYVLELVPSPSYGLRLVDIAAQLLRPGGLALVQTKYTTASTSSRPRRRSYRRDLANMTTYPIDEFWVEAGRRGLQPLVVHLVPKNELDERYAYYLLQRTAS